MRRDDGTNCTLFVYRRPTRIGHLIRENIRMPSQGYTEASFKRAAHEYERELVLVTEEPYSRLRKQGKTLKSAARKTRGIEILAGGDSQDNEWIGIYKIFGYILHCQASVTQKVSFSSLDMLHMNKGKDEH